MGLKEIHALGFAHCDLKPDNLMFIIEQVKIRLQIIDFGLVEKFDVGDSKE
jgi:serine/threonine protein kinase